VYVFFSTWLSSCVTSAAWLVFGFVFITTFLFSFFFSCEFISLARCSCYTHDPAQSSFQNNNNNNNGSFQNNILQPQYTPKQSSYLSTEARQTSIMSVVSSVSFPCCSSTALIHSAWTGTAHHCYSGAPSDRFQ